VGLHRFAVVAGSAAVVCIGLSACTSSTPGSAINASTSPAGKVSSSSPAVAAQPAVISTSPASGAATKISPSHPITVSVASGRLESVTLTNPQGKVVTGAMSADGTSWHNTEDLGYSKTYKLTADAVNADGVSATQKASFTTLTPRNVTMASFQRMGGYSLTSGATYGVGIVPSIHFDEPITDKAAAQRALTVTSTPAVVGAWDWIDSQDVHYRPEAFWPSGTKVTISANVYGVKVGHGLYGESDVSRSFTIGASQITIADDNAPKVDKVRVYHNGVLVRTMNTSMGRHSGETVDGQYINFYTMVGTYTVLEHDNPAIMSSASYGLPADAPGGYAPEPIYYSTKISTDGIYLHELDTTIWAQDHGYDVSHGCLNLDTANAIWFYDHSQIGDPVEIRHTGGPTIAEWQGGDWSIPWSTWIKGSALPA
jgi:lipoprotein-anchoring transpeptidase ErfK/SrfK